MVSAVTSFLASCPSPLRSSDLTPVPVLFLFPTAVGEKTPFLARGPWISEEQLQFGYVQRDRGKNLDGRVRIWAVALGAILGCEVWWLGFCSVFPGRGVVGGS